MIRLSLHSSMPSLALYANYHPQGHRKATVHAAGLKHGGGGLCQYLQTDEPTAPPTAASAAALLLAAHLLSRRPTATARTAALPDNDASGVGCWRRRWLVGCRTGALRCTLVGVGDVSSKAGRSGAGPSSGAVELSLQGGQWARGIGHSSSRSQLAACDCRPRSRGSGGGGRQAPGAASSGGRGVSQHCTGKAAVLRRIAAHEAGKRARQVCMQLLEAGMGPGSRQPTAAHEPT